MRPSAIATIAAELGARVLPIRIEDGRKRALIKDWPRRATSDPEVITSPEWRERWRHANAIGATLDGLAVLDFDPLLEPHTHGCLAQAALKAFEADLGADLPAEAFRQRTGRGGLHVVCRAPDGPIWRGTAFRTYDGLGKVDIKAGAGNLIVIVPSAGYRFLDGTPSLRPADLPPLPSAIAEALRDHAPAPSGLNHHVCVDHKGWRAVAELSRGYRPLERTARYLLEDCRRLASAPDGEQEATLFRLGYKWGGRVRCRYISAERVLRSLTNAAMAMPNYRPHEPWHRGEVEAKLRDSILAGYAHAC